MKIEKNKMVSLVYELREGNQDGRIIEKLDEERPLTFLYGAGRLLPFFESNINELKNGDNFEFTALSDMAYGERREEMIVDVPIDVFKSEGVLNDEICQVGNRVPMMDQEGNPIDGIITDITESHVKMDFNHPMAGVDLHFTGRITGVRDATEDELAGLNHSCSSCGSGHDGCSDCN